MADDTTSYGFLCGADMEPGKIRRHPATSDSRFAGIGWVARAALADRDLPLPDVEEIWGVVVTLPEGIVGSRVVPVTLRIGEVVSAVVLTDAASFGDRDAVVAEAYYWELPRSWREALAAAFA